MAGNRAPSSLVLLLLLLLVLAQGAYVGIDLYLTPMVAAVLPSPAKPGDVVKIQGANFAPEAWDNAVLFGSQSGRITKATPTALEVEVPELAGVGAGGTQLAVRVVVGGRVSAPFGIRLAPPVLTAASPGPPEPSPTPEPSPEATPARPAPRPTLRAAPSATPAPLRVADLLAQAASAESARRYDEAEALYAKAVAAEPGNAKAQAGLKAAQAAAAALKKTFQAGRTVVEGPQVGRSDFKDFDTREVAVRKAPEVPGRIEFEIAPARLVAGDKYAVKVYLQNEGTRPIRIASMQVTTTVNGSASGATTPPPRGDVAARARALIHQTEGVWKEGTTSWALYVQVSSAKGDNYRNQAVWK